MMPLKLTYIRKKELDGVLNKAMALPRLKDLLDMTNFTDTSLDCIPLLRATLGSRVIADISIDIFKLDDSDRFAVYVTSKNCWENQYFYTHTLNRNDLDSLIRSIIKTFKRRYCRMYLVYVTRGLVWGR